MQGPLPPGQATLAAGRGQAAPRRRQHRRRHGHPAALDLPRPGAHHRDLHPAPVRRRPLPGRARSTARARAYTPLLDAAAAKARPTCAPPTTCCPTWSSPCAARASRSTSPAASTRPRAGGCAPPSPIVPDAPVSKFVARMYGGRRGILENGDNLCASPQVVAARFLAHSNRGWLSRPELRASCKRGKRQGKGGK